MNTEVDIHAARPWWKDAVVYQIYPRSFADTDADGMGDLPGIIDRLPYLRTLGVDAIWICPFYTSPMVDYGYDVVDHTAVDPISAPTRTPMRSSPPSMRMACASSSTSCCPTPAIASMVPRRRGVSDLTDAWNGPNQCASG